MRSASSHPDTTPEAAGFGRGAVLPSVGRAQRWARPCGAELWVLPEADDPVVPRLTALAEHGIGLVVAAGHDASGAWLVRDLGDPTLASWLSEHGTTPIAWRDAVTIADAVAAGLAALEAQSLRAGPVVPTQIRVAQTDPGSATPGATTPGSSTMGAASGVDVRLAADDLVHGLVGGASVSGQSSVASRWIAPAQAGGAPWDPAADRYVLGLVLYRMLAGRHPFSGQGMRQRLTEQAEAGAPPLPEAVASTLPPGLQALTLRMLDPDLSRRPSSADAIRHELATFVVPARSDDADAGADAGPSTARPDEPAPSTVPGPPPAVTPPAPPSPDDAWTDEAVLRAVARRRAAVRAERNKTPTPVADPAGPPPQPSTPAAVIPAGAASPHGTAAEATAPAPVSAQAAASAPSAVRVASHVDASAPVSAAPPVGAAAPVSAVVPVSAAAPIARTRATADRGRWFRRIAGLVPVALGVGLATVLVGAVDPPPPPPGRAASVAATTPLGTTQTRPDDCATCHPEQTAQWHLSVMAHSVKSPLFQGLEILIQEQAGKSFDCPDGAGILRPLDPSRACRDPDTGLAITGAGGELWCVNCHSPGNSLDDVVPPWDAFGRGASSRRPLVDILPASTMDGISCAFCHQVHGPVQPGDERRGGYEGNPDWVSFVSGIRFESRPEDRRGQFGIANSGYSLDPRELLAALATGGDGQLRTGLGARAVPGGTHLRPSDEARQYLASSDFCGACHDVRLFGTDVLGASKGEHFKRLRNAYSEWAAWAQDERRLGRDPASCQDCHMSTFPGVCAPGDEPAPPSSASALRRACPDGTHFEARPPGSRPTGSIATASAPSSVSTHYFSGVDVPLSDLFPKQLVDDDGLDPAGVPRGAEQRRDMLLGSTFRFELDRPSRRGRTLRIPVEIENVGAGHRVPAGFSQEREFWVHLTVRDARGRLVYEVGRVDRPEEDLHDKRFVRVNTDDRFIDEQGRPLGMFGADVVDGPDVPQWSPPPDEGGTEFFGRGLINLQNGFLRCVTCVGFVDGQGRCQPGAGQGVTRADRFDDGVYDIDTGECQSNLFGDNALLETYFPVGALDAERGVLKAPDAIIDRRSAAPGRPLRYTYELQSGGFDGPFTVEARLLFRAFPPFLVKAFADYEARQDAKGLRPSGPLVNRDMLQRLEIVELSRVTGTVE